MPAQLHSAPLLLERRSTLWFVAAVIAVLFTVTNLPWTLDEYDQAKQAFTSFEMVNGGRWFYQHTPSEKIATKPPLVGGISAGVYSVTRNWELAWRLPSFAAAAAIAVLLTGAAMKAYGDPAGVIALAAFGLNMLSVRLATLVRTDMPLALVTSAIGMTIWQKVRSGRAWQPRDRVLLFALLTAAMLIKGPIIYAFILPGLIFFQIRRRKAGGASAWCGWWPWIASLAVFGAWVAGGIAMMPGFYDQVVLREFAGRFGETVHRPQPFYFYIPHLLQKFAPWSLLGIGLATARWRRGTGGITGRWRALSPEFAWLICWTLGGLVLMSLVPSKRVDRIFPVVPPMCLLIAAGIGHLTNANPAAARRWCTVTLLVACLFTGGYAAQRIILSCRAGDAALVNFGDAVRSAAAAENLRYEVIGRSEEGMLLYLRHLHFINIDEAIARWNSGTLDALVAPADEASRLTAELNGSTIAATSAPNRHRSYVFLKKTRP